MEKTPEAWDFAVTSCLRRATRNSGPLTPPTQKLTDYVTLKRTFHNTAARFHNNGSCGLRRSRLGVGRLLTNIAHLDSPSDSAPPLSFRNDCTRHWVPRPTAKRPQCEFSEISRKAVRNAMGAPSHRAFVEGWPGL